MSAELATQEETGEIVRKQNLFEIGAELEAIFDAYDQVEGDPSEEIKKQLEAYFEKIGENLEDKLCAYRHLVAKFEKSAEWRKEESDRLDALAKRDKANAERLRKRLADFFEATGNKKIETRLGPIRVQGNGGLQPLQFIRREMVDGEPVVVVLDKEPDVSEVPEEFIRHKPEIDNAAIRAKLDEGTELPFAQLGERSKRVVFA